MVSGAASATLALVSRHNEVEAPLEILAGARHPHDEFAAEEAVAPVHRLVGKIELRGEHPRARLLNLDVEVPRAADVERRHDRAEAVASLRVGEDVAAQPEASVVVVAVVVGMQQVDQRMCERLAAAIEHLPGEDDRAALDARLDQIGALGRARLEERPLGLGTRRLVAVVAGRRERRLAPRDAAETERGAGLGTRGDETATGGYE